MAQRAADPPLRVLLVDDDEDFTVVMRRILQATGAPMTIDAAHDVSAGLRAIDRHRYDIVFSDFDLKASTGLTILAHARRKQSHGLRILITGTPGRVPSCEADASGVHFLWDKSWDAQRLAAFTDASVRAAAGQPGPAA